MNRWSLMLGLLLLASFGSSQRSSRNRPNPFRKAHQKQLLAQEDTAGTSDLLRQLTQIRNRPIQDETSDPNQMTSKEGNLELDDPKKPTKYHYYPHYDNVYLLPECATQQVCNAVYTRLNYTQPLCACADRFKDPCSASLSRNDRRTIEVSLKKSAKTPTLVKTCEKSEEIRECRTPQDWSLLALQNVRTGKSQYLVICRCNSGSLDGPINHDQPSFARVPGIRVYGMLCNNPDASSANGSNSREKRDVPEFPWSKAQEFAGTLDWV